MDGVRLATLAQRGYGIAGAKVGLPYAHYRPHRLFGPLADLSRLGIASVAFDRSAAFPFQGQAKHSEAIRHALIDGTSVLHGDYLVPEDPSLETLFVASPGIIHATLCIACNATLNLRRVDAPEGVGAVGYRATAVQEEDLFLSWPASVLDAGRGGAGEAGLPGALPVGDSTILLPRCSALPAIRKGDVLPTEDGRRFGVMRAESGHLGWRVAARTLVAT
ncbi:hypothetical protein [Roseomonas chloroacetimidivorans]|uniref:hypothetical protein n=1 Tax=Roseomonas chloroacetimidivorans TaxID=1766656 RepID=UPI003C727B91